MFVSQKIANPVSLRVDCITLPSCSQRKLCSKCVTEILFNFQHVWRNEIAWNVMPQAILVENLYQIFNDIFHKYVQTFFFSHFNFFEKHSLNFSENLPLWSNAWRLHVGFNCKFGVITYENEIFFCNFDDRTSCDAMIVWCWSRG